MNSYVCSILPFQKIIEIHSSSKYNQEQKKAQVFKINWYSIYHPSLQVSFNLYLVQLLISEKVRKNLIMSRIAITITLNSHCIMNDLDTTN